MNSIIVICLAIPITIFGGWYYIEKGLPWDAAAAKKEIGATLQERYGEVFELKGMRFDLMHDRQYFTTATSPNNGTSFYVELNNGVVNDSYGYTYWGMVKSQQALKIINERFPEVQLIELFPYSDSEDNLPLAEQIHSMRWPVNFEVNVTILEDNLQQELARAHETFTALQQDMPLVSFFIHYNNHALSISEEKMKESFTLQEFQTFLKTYDVFR